MKTCDNCGHKFETGKFSDEEDDIFEDVCPNCGNLVGWDSRIMSCEEDITRLGLRKHNEP